MIGRYLPGQRKVTLRRAFRDKLQMPAELIRP